MHYHPYGNNTLFLFVEFDAGEGEASVHQLEACIEDIRVWVNTEAE